MTDITKRLADAQPVQNTDKKVWDGDGYKISVTLGGGINIGINGFHIVKTAAAWHALAAAQEANVRGGEVHAWVLLGPAGWDGYRELMLSDTDPSTHQQQRAIAPGFAWYPLAAPHPTPAPASGEVTDEMVQRAQELDPLDMEDAERVRAILEHALDAPARSAARGDVPNATPKAEADPFADKYHELLMAVASKFPGESRHATALRYINERENLPTHGPAQNATLTSGSKS